MKKLISIVVVGAALAVPAGAHAHGIAVDTPRGTYYVNDEDPSLWKETNSDPGLQTKPHEHVIEGRVVVIPADTKIDDPGDL